MEDSHRGAAEEIRGYSRVCPVKMEESLGTTLSVSLKEFVLYLKPFRRMVDLMICGLNHW